MDNNTSPPKQWFVIRVTLNRARAVYEDLMRRNIEDIEFYIPTSITNTLHIEEGILETRKKEEIIMSGLIFAHATHERFRELMHDYAPAINGMTPYYDHFHEYESGKNDYLFVPDKQFEAFRLICMTPDDNKITDQSLTPKYLIGKKVRVTDGLFKGVEGTLLRWRSLRRVFVDLHELGKYGTGFIRSCDFEIIEEATTPPDKDAKDSPKASKHTPRKKNKQQYHHRNNKKKQ